MVESQRDQRTELIIGLAIEVHRQLGPGLLESAYEACLCFELNAMGLPYSRQVRLPVKYKDVMLECGYRMDIVVEDQLVSELKTVVRLLPIHGDQMLTYLRLSGIRTGVLLNFNTVLLKDGLRRLVW